MKNYLKYVIISVFFVLQIANAQYDIGNPQLLYADKDLPPTSEFNSGLVIDAPLATVRYNDTLFDFFFSSYAGLAKFRGPINAPFDTLIWEKSRSVPVFDLTGGKIGYTGIYAGKDVCPYGVVDGQLLYNFHWNGELTLPNNPLATYAWLPNIYAVNDTDMVGFLHVEDLTQCESKYDEHVRYRIGLAYSNNRGKSWVYCGEIIRPFEDWAGYKIKVPSAQVSNSNWLENWCNGTFWDLFVGDVDNDGDVDLIGEAGGTWNVAISNDGRFTPSTYYWLENWCNGTFWDLFVGDVDNDGDVDLIGEAGGTWNVAINNGSGFTPSANYWLEDWCNGTFWDLFVGDVDNDGDVDLIGEAGGTWNVAINNGSGFTPSANYWLEDWANGTDWDLFVADVNGDGYDDLIAEEGGGWNVALSDGTNFTPTNSVWLNNWGVANTWDLNVKDVNNDGRADIVGENNGEWHVAFSDGSKFVNASTLLENWANGTGWDLFVNDVNGDGTADFIAENNGEWHVALNNIADGHEVYRGNNLAGVPYVVKDDYFYIYFNEYFGGDSNVPSRGDQTKICVARAKVSEVINAASQLNVTTWKKYFNGEWSQNGLTGEGSNIIPEKMEMALDFHSDAAYCKPLKKYLLTTYAARSRSVVMFSSKDGIQWHNPVTIDDAADSKKMHSCFVGLEGASADCRELGNNFSIIYPRQPFIQHSVDSIYRVQINATSRFDVIAEMDGDWSVASSDGTRFNVSTTDWLTGWADGSNWDLFIGDVNGDGNRDLIAENNGGWNVAISDGTRFTPSPTLWLIGWADGTDWDLFVGDVNGDGTDEIIGEMNGSWNVATSDGSEFTLSGSQWLTSWADGTDWGLFVGDVNGDGKDDLIGERDGTWNVAISDGSSFTLSSTNWLTNWANGAYWDLFVADVNGDGKADLVGEAGGTWNVALSDGSSFTPESSYWLTSWANGTHWDLFVGDVNGDGNDDLIGEAGGTWNVALSDGSKFTPFANYWLENWRNGAEWDLLMGDVNGR